MDYFVVESTFQPLFAQLGLGDCAGTIHHFTGAELAPPKKTAIKPSFLGTGESSVPIFYKQYSFAKPSWRFLGRASKARREYENYAVFKDLNITCAERMACGEQRDELGRLQRAFIITRAVPNVETLLEFIPKHCPSRTTAQSREMRGQILQQLASMTRRIHEVGFFHNDLYWRNILVQWKPGEAPKLWWIDCPRGGFARFPFFQSHRRIKDLAALDKSAEQLLSVGERIAFVKLYLGEKRLGSKARQLIRDTLAYRQSRWGRTEKSALQRA